MDKTWIGKSRVSFEYKNGVDCFIRFAIENGSIDGMIFCPCRNCHNKFMFDPKDVKEHLMCNPFASGYTNWIFHGESVMSQSSDDDNDNDDNVMLQSPINFKSSESHVGIIDDMSGLINDALGTLPDTSFSKDQFTESKDEPSKTSCKLLDDNDQELYPGCQKYSKLSFLVHLLNLKCMNRWSGKSFSMLLTLLKDAFPNASLPLSYYEAKKLFKQLGLGYEKIHACVNDCMLYYDERDKQESCHVCGVSRWMAPTDNNDLMDGQDRVLQKRIPIKILRYFPLIPRLKRIYMSPKTASSMRWHHEGRTKDGMLRHPADALAWQSFDAHFPEFASNPRNVRLGLASDGFNPFRAMSTTYSTWPVVVMFLNFPPWLCMKESYLMLSSVIPGEKGPGNDIDIYLQPLIKELQKLWEGVDAYDAFTKQNFKLRAALMWTNNDFPAYANLSGWSTKGRIACPCCGEHTESRWLKYGGKYCYMGHRRWLDQNHPFRLQNNQFDGTQEFRIAPIPPSGADVLKQMNRLNHIYGKASRSLKKKRKHDVNASTHQIETEDVDTVNQTGLFDRVDDFLDMVEDDIATSSMSSTPQQLWKKRSIFFDLPYWKFQLLRHNLDVMHIEKNVCDNLIGTMLNIEGRTKDNLKARLDLREMGIKHDLHPKLLPDGKFMLPPASYVMSLQEKDDFLKVLKDIKVPDGFSSNISRCVNLKERKLSNLKSHDAHVLMQDLIPIAIRASMPNFIVAIVCELSAFFKAICSKVINPSELDQLQSQIALTLCHMEKVFPPSFFTIMVHLMIHLVAEVKLGGTVHTRWMYPIERYLMQLKSYVCNKAHPEGSIAEGYIARECVIFCSRYLHDTETIHNRLPRNFDVVNTLENFMFSSGGEAKSKGDSTKLDPQSLAQAHRYVLLHSDKITNYQSDFLAVQRAKHNFHTNRNLENKWLIELFPEWLFCQVPNMVANGSSDELISLAKGPNGIVRKFSGLVINGFRFHTRDREKFRKAQNSGIVVDADGRSYYGILTDIIELDYSGSFKVLMFRCDWVDINSPRGLRSNKNGDVYVNFSRLIHTGKQLKDDPFIFSSQAKQVFYIQDPQDKMWYKVVRTRPRDLYDMGSRLEEEDDGTYPHCIPSNVTLDKELSDCICLIRTDV